MRLLLLLCLALLSLGASAQTPGDPLRQRLDKAFEDYRINQRAEQFRAQRFPPGITIDSVKKYLDNKPAARTLSPGVHVLPQDRMPCIVPDLSEVARVPNAAPKVYPYRKDMPNAHRPPAEVPNTPPLTPKGGDKESSK